ncbi:MAG TPA: tetratricopeptide repeat protein [Candidatus Latescibacteria bacterium]|nr:tetratricopeptide repeat protein [Candidatus Latescibacterota bacterium]
MRFWIWWGISLVGVSSPGAEGILSLADSLYACENYYEAITEYHRYLFFNPRTDLTGYAWWRIGLAHRALGEWDRALESFRRAEEHARTDKERDRYRVERALLLMAQDRWESAQVVLLRTAAFGGSPAVRKRAWFFLGVGYVNTFRWGEAEEAFRRCFDPEDPRWRQVRTLLERGRRLKFKSPHKARLLSTFLPGLGQAYVGDWEAALNALVLNGLTCYLWGKLAFERRYMNAAFWFLSLFWRYYRGNRFRVEKLVEARNFELQRALAVKVLDALAQGGEEDE